MKKMWVFVVLLFLIGCQEPVTTTVSNTVNKTVNTVTDSVNKIKDIIIDNSPKWVKTIKKGEKINHYNQRCYDVQVNSATQLDAQRLVQKNIYQQIANEIMVNVNSQTKINQSIYNNQINKNFSSDVSIKSFADVSGIHIDHFYYDQSNKKAYGYVCLSENSFKNIQKQSMKKYNNYLKDMTALQLAINNGDAEQANNLITKIKATYNVQNNSSFQSLENKAANLARINIILKEKFYANTPLYVTVYTNKNLYLNVVLKQNNRYLLLYPNPQNLNNIIVTNQSKKIYLMSKIVNIKSGDLIFYFSDTPLNLMQYARNKKLSGDWQDYIFTFMNTHYLKKITKKLLIVSHAKTKVCLKTNFIGQWSDEVYSEFISVVKNTFNITCEDTPYELEIDYQAKQTDVIDVSVDMILRKNAEEIDEVQYGDIFPNKRTMIDDQILPNMVNKLRQLKESF